MNLNKYAKYTTESLKSKRKQLDEDEDQVQLDVESLGYFVEQRVACQYTVPIDTDFKEPSYYRAVVNMLMSANEHDNVVFLINSPGGSLAGLLTLLEGINMSEATTNAVIVGSASSAASMLSLACDNVFVSENSTMLAHNISYGAAGKGSDVLAHVEHTTKTANKLIRKIYEGFLTDSEMNEMLNGKEIYFDSDEIIERLEQRELYREEKAKAEQEQQEQLENPKAKPPAKRKAPTKKA